LENYSWPGNIRELENAVERAVYVSTHECISRDCLPSHIILSAEEKGNYGDYEYGSPLNDNSIQRRERRQIEETLRKCNGNISMAAEMLGISRRTIYRKMEKYGISVEAMRRGGFIK
jgi:DNA-binding NtrC family response regulator